MSDFISTQLRPRNEQAFKLNFSVMENKGTLFVEAIDGEIKKLVVDNSEQRNRKKKKKTN